MYYLIIVMINKIQIIERQDIENMSDNNFNNTPQLTPHSNLLCDVRLTCNARSCPLHTDFTGKRPKCWIEKYPRYQPDTYSNVWYERDWDELKNITWYDVFSLKESWMYFLILIVTAVFIFYCTVLTALYAGTF